MSQPVEIKQEPFSENIPINIASVKEEPQDIPQPIDILQLKGCSDVKPEFAQHSSSFIPQQILPNHKAAAMKKECRFNESQQVRRGLQQLKFFIQDFNKSDLNYINSFDRNDRDTVTSDMISRADSVNNISTVGHQLIESKKSGTDDSDENYSDEDLVECRICRKRFADSDELDGHLKTAQIDKSFTCCACGKSFRDNSQLNVHSRTHTGEQPYACKLCDKRFSINGNLSKHMRTHTGERRFQCEICQKKFTQFAHLEDHIKTHSVERPYQCSICMSAFKTKARLRKHVKCHQEERINKRCVRCPVCNKILKSTRQLSDHIKTHTTDDEPYNCIVCGKNYKTLFYLQTHQKLHGGIKTFKCSLCEKAFATSSQLRRHINSHAGIKPFNCDICQRAFPSTQNLKRHMLTHTGIKPYSCETCSKGFLTLENLNRHKRIHTGEKPYPCDICGKRFAHSTTVKEHRRIHTGDRPFKCHLCGKRFTANKMLYKHIRMKHPEHFDAFKEMNMALSNRLNNRIIQFKFENNPNSAFIRDRTEIQEREHVEFKPEIKAEPITEENTGLITDIKYNPVFIKTEKEDVS